ncbi:hypothetical protein ABK040_003827 [Willaertia magna]
MSTLTVTHNGESVTVLTTVKISSLESFFNVSKVFGLKLNNGLSIDLRDNDLDRTLLTDKEATLLFNRPSPLAFLYLIKSYYQRIETINFDSIHWITNSLYNPQEKSAEFKGISVKTQDYNDKIISLIVIVNRNGQYTILALPRNDVPLLYYFQNNNNTENLKVISGMAHPLHLAHGNVSTDGKIGLLQSNWRINAINSAYMDNNNKKIFGSRIGGFFTYRWDSNYGVDSLGNLCSAECCGCGITDTVYEPMTSGKKSFGVRQAHDNNSLPGGGQITDEVHIYGL